MGIKNLMKLKIMIIVSIITGIAVMHCISSDSTVVKNSDHTLPSDIAGSPRYKEGKFKVDAVIISHDHYDHLNECSVQRLIEKSNKFIVPLANRSGTPGFKRKYFASDSLGHI